MGLLPGEFVYLMLTLFLYMVLTGTTVNYAMDLPVSPENREETIGTGKR